MEKSKCKYCDKVIEGHTKNQVEHIMLQHIIARHPDRIKIEEVKK